MRSVFKLLGHLAVMATLALAACQPAPVAPQASAGPPAPLNGVGYVIFSAPIVPQSSELLMGDINKLVAAGARSIHLAINSPGGQIDSAQTIVDYMARLHGEGVTFEVYNVGLVASAASYVFLTAQRRFATPNSAFLFHAAGLTSNGLVPAERLREEADKLDAYERVVRAVMKARTKLSDSEAQTYVRRTVLLNADDARRDGVIDAIAPFSIPQGGRAWTIMARPATPAARPIPPPPPN